MDTKRSNTATWVDERDARRLSRQAIETLDADREDASALRRLAAIRCSPLYLREERTRIGPGFRRGTRVWHLDTWIPQAELDMHAPEHQTLVGIKVFATDYDDNGDVRLNKRAGLPLANVSLHALRRLFERLRTNALDDVVREAMLPLTRVAPPEFVNRGKDGQITLPELGIMHATVELACAVDGTPVGAFWQIKTFVPNRSIRAGSKQAGS